MRIVWECLIVNWAIKIVGNVKKAPFVCLIFIQFNMSLTGFPNKLSILASVSSFFFSSNLNLNLNTITNHAIKRHLYMNWQWILACQQQRRKPSICFECNDSCCCCCYFVVFSSIKFRRRSYWKTKSTFLSSSPYLFIRIFFFYL